MTTLAAQAPRRRKLAPRLYIVRWLVGAVLLTAAGMKGYELATGPVAEKGLLTSRWLLIVAVEFELALGLCFMGGVWKRQIWWAAAVMSFAAFTCITAYKAWQGEASCGCLGFQPVLQFRLRQNIYVKQLTFATSTFGYLRNMLSVLAMF